MHLNLKAKQSYLENFYKMCEAETIFYKMTKKEEVDIIL